MENRKTFRELMDDHARVLIERTLTEFNGNQCAAAEALGLHRNTLARNMKDLGIDAKVYYVKAKKIPSHRTYRKLQGIA